MTIELQVRTRTARSGVHYASEASRMRIPRPAPCMGMTELFYGPDVDGRTEKHRVARETKAKRICMSCECRLACLENALVLGEDQGVWGGMSESDRHKFKLHLAYEGYDGSIPEGAEFWAVLNSFYRRQERLMQERYS